MLADTGVQRKRRVDNPRSRLTFVRTDLTSGVNG